MCACHCQSPRVAAEHHLARSTCADASGVRSPRLGDDGTTGRDMLFMPGLLGWAKPLMPPTRITDLSDGSEGGFAGLDHHAARRLQTTNVKAQRCFLRMRPHTPCTNSSNAPLAAPLDHPTHIAGTRTFHRFHHSHHTPLTFSIGHFSGAATARCSQLYPSLSPLPTPWLLRTLRPLPPLCLARSSAPPRAERPTHGAA